MATHVCVAYVCLGNKSIVAISCLKPERMHVLTELRLCIFCVTPPYHCMQAEECLARKNLDKEYADILGIPAFRQATAELMLTKSCPFVQKKQVGLDVCPSPFSLSISHA